MGKTKINTCVVVFCLFSSLLLQSCGSTPDSEQVSCVKNISHQIKSIELSSDNSDLQFLKDILLKDSIKIVLLGEQSHGDGTTITARAKLIKFLHEELGFDVLAFESGLYDCYKGWQLIKKENDYNWGLTYSVNGFWSFSREIQPLIKYLQTTLSTPNPVVLAGFDNQLTGSASMEKLFTDFKKLDILNDSSNEIIRFKSIVDFLDYTNTDKYKEDTINSGVYFSEVNLLNSIITRLDTMKNSSDTNMSPEFWKRVIEGIKVELNFLYHQHDANSDTAEPLSNERDLEMGKNLVWLMDNMYKNKKIIVWSVDFHIMRNFSNIQFSGPLSTTAGKAYTMGDYIWKELGKKMYSISFTDYENYMDGSRSTSDSSIEYSLDKAGFDYAFINLRDTAKTSCLGNYFNCKILGHQQWYGKWNDVTDGIFFIEDIKVSELKKNE